MPDPLLPVAVVAKSKADEDKLSQGLGRLVAEDPTLRLENNPETHQLVLWCMGEAHLDVLLDRLKNRYGVEVESVPLRVQLRETFAGKATAKGRHVKQSGGHGQYAICDIEVEPLESGQGFEFVDKVVGGAVPRQFIPSVEKGVRTQMERGVAAGYPVVDIRVTLIDGKAHSVDSSDMAFQTAGALALKEAARATRIHMLEPVDEVQVLVSDEYVGAVMSDLSTRRGRVTGTESVGSGRSMVRADVPQVEITRYASTCARSRTAPAPSPGPTCGTSRCRPSWRRSSRTRPPTTSRPAAELGSASGRGPRAGGPAQACCPGAGAAAGSPAGRPPRRPTTPAAPGATARGPRPRRRTSTSSRPAAPAPWQMRPDGSTRCTGCAPPRPCSRRTSPGRRPGTAPSRFPAAQVPVDGELDAAGADAAGAVVQHRRPGPGHAATLTGRVITKIGEIDLCRTLPAAGPTSCCSGHVPGDHRGLPFGPCEGATRGAAARTRCLTGAVGHR